MLGVNRVSYFGVSVSSLLSCLGSTYSVSCWTLLAGFLALRIPLVYGVFGFICFIFVVVSPLFLSLFIGRMAGGVDSFFSSLLPPGTPLWIAPFVGLAETISYLVRPFVLMIRPFLNITIGALGGASLAGMCVSSWPLLACLVFLFMYEVFVAIVHWFIVVNILDFSIDH
uniref:ATP synthase F0 subunit 6 n=1 Tax=Dactylogyrus tuba TaxID=231340 RepID=UPI002E794E70|nr:ATP synthase F0 subunit 6 [Dactylogyrus tuba]WCF76308.1 ATP synthase F0 subunit 6 [Dactylogyrus tuba]